MGVCRHLGFMVYPSGVVPLIHTLRGFLVIKKKKKRVYSYICGKVRGCRSDRILYQIELFKTPKLLELHRSCAKCLWGFRSPSIKDLGAFFLFFGGVGSVGNKSWGFRTGKVTVEIFTKCIISRLGFFIQLGIVMGWDGFQFNLLVFRCMIGTRLKALMWK